MLAASHQPQGVGVVSAGGIGTFGNHSLDVAAARSDDGGGDGDAAVLVVKVVNPWPANITAAVSVRRGGAPANVSATATATYQVLTGPLNGDNSMADPTAFAPVDGTVVMAEGAQLTHVFPAFSFTVLTIPL
jgi:hypothetical protein